MTDTLRLGTVKMQVELVLPAQSASPVQLVKMVPGFGVAVRLTGVPKLRVSEQSAPPLPQLMMPGGVLLVTVPCELLPTVSTNCRRTNCPVTVTLAPLGTNEQVKEL